MTRLPSSSSTTRPLGQAIPRRPTSGQSVRHRATRHRRLSRARVAGVGQRLLDLADPQRAEVEDGGGEDRVGAGVDRGREVLEPRRRRREAITGIGRPRGGPARISSRSKPSWVPSASIALSRISPAPSSAARAAHSIASRPADLRPPWVVTSKPESVPARPAGVDGEHQHLVAEPVGDLGDQLGPADRGGVDGDLVGAGAQQPVDVLDAADSPADGQRDEDLLGGAARRSPSWWRGPRGRRRCRGRSARRRPRRRRAAASSTGSPASRRSWKLMPLTTRPASTSRHGMTRTARRHAAPPGQRERVLEGEPALVERGADDRALDPVGDQAHAAPRGRRAR